MQLRIGLSLALVCAGLLSFTSPAAAEVFKSPKECVIGKRVTNSLNESGRIVKVVETTMCVVALDKGGTKSSLFWMLRAEGVSSETDDKLIPGRYACYASGQYTFMDINITGPATYQSSGSSGRYHLESASRRIVFESGNLARYKAKLVRGPNIDINSDGSDFYGTTCSYQKK